MPDQPFAAPQTTVACPFCGLGCDDLSPLRRNDDLSVLEEAGWMISSLGEARNPADLVVLVGNSRTERFPRLAERILKPTARLHAPTEATLVELHTAANDADAQAASAPHQPDAAASDAQASADTALRSGQLRDFVGVLRARLANRPLDRDPFPAAAALAERLTAAAYPLIAFSAADLQSEPQPDLAVRALAALVRQLNEGGRAAPLPLRGADGESSAHQVSAWHTG